MPKRSEIRSANLFLPRVAPSNRLRARLVLPTSREHAPPASGRVHPSLGDAERFRPYDRIRRRAGPPFSSLLLLSIVALSIAIPSGAIAEDPSPLEASPGGPITSSPSSPEASLRFADHLYEHHDYYRAITEYKRFLFFHPHDPRASLAHLRIALCYQEGGAWEAARIHFDDLVRHGGDRSIVKRALFQRARTDLLAGNYAAAIAAFERFRNRYPDDELARKALYEMGWAYIYRKEFHEAAETIEKLSPKTEESNRLLQRLQAAPFLPRKSPLVAGLLSTLLPGAGQVYTGRFANGASAFLVNVLFFTGTYQAFDRGLYTIGGFLSIFTLGWYSGNIFSAVNSAHHFNKRVEETFIHDLESMLQ